MGAMAVPLVIITGLGNGAFMAVLAGGALGPRYTQVLAVKLGFVLSLFAVAAVNRFRLTPMMSRNPLRATAALGRTILLEQFLGLGAVASVALLGQLDPTM
jgi:putative copper export protein